MIEEKQCVACGNTKSAGDFYKDKRMKSGLSSECKKCVRSRNKEYLKTYKRKDQDGNELTKEGLRLKNRGYYLMSKYGISNSQYDEMVTVAGGKCEICGNSDVELYVDHCHTNDFVRGLLCMHCNFGIGHFSDSVEKMESAIKYIKLYEI